jgi:hypothetical protein
MKNPRITTKALLATAAITGMMAGSAVRAHATTTNSPVQLHSAGTPGLLADDSSAGKHDCKGMNSCKGLGGCKTSDNGCKGLNSCKGKGGCDTNHPKT